MASNKTQNRHLQLSSSVDWRWTSQPLSVFGFHISIAAFFPFLLLSAHLFRLDVVIIFFIAYVAFLFVCKARKMTPLEYAGMLFVRLFYRLRWEAR